jgi:thioredoxin 1
MDGAQKHDESWPVQAIDLTEDEFNQFVFSHHWAVVVCWSGWCKHSRNMMPVIDDAAKELTGKIAFGKVNAQQNTHFPVRFKVKATPTSLVFKDGILVGSVVGDMSKDELIKRLYELVGDSSTSAS